jgi:preprotein translocase subunit SecE
VARDRKRAKQRRDRSARRSGARGTAGAVPTPNVPGELEHASSGADEFDAALVRGAEAAAAPLSDVPDAPDTDAPDAADVELDDEPLVVDEDADVEDRLDEAGISGNGGIGSDGGVPGLPGVPGGGGRGGEAALPRPSGAPLPSGNRAVAFLRASWAELQRVQWPDRRHVAQATAVVLGFVVVAGLYLGLADIIAKEVVEFIL